MSALAKLEEKLADQRATAKELRAENTELLEQLEMALPQCRSPVGRIASNLLQTMSAYGFGRGYIKLQQIGLMPKRFPVDLLLGTLGQVPLAFSCHPVARIAEDVLKGVTAGAGGREALLAQLVRVEVGGQVVLLLPGGTATPTTPGKAAA
jgi:hypothetical protein